MEKLIGEKNRKLNRNKSVYSSKYLYISHKLLIKASLTACILANFAPKILAWKRKMTSQVINAYPDYKTCLLYRCIPELVII